MQDNTRQSIYYNLIIPFCCMAIVWITGYSYTITQNRLLLVASLSFCIHGLIGIPSVIWRSEKLYDITGTIAVWTMMIGMSTQTIIGMDRAGVLASLCLLWTTRLGLFLLLRIHRHRKDARFDQMKKNPWSFLVAWQMSAVWTIITTLAALSAIASPHQSALTTLDLCLLAGWICAFSLEAIADWQKYQFKQKKQATPFIQSGLWAYSRHPNYLAEMLMWFFVAGLAVPNLQNSLFISLISPIFVVILLTFVSGINLLEAASDKKFGHLKAYRAYKQKTPVLLPKLTRLH